MVAYITVGDTDVTEYVLKGGVRNISFEVQDEEGALLYPTVSLSLSNLEGTFDVWRKTPPTDQLITISVHDGSNVYSLFRGFLAENGYKEPVDLYIVELQLIHESVTIVNTLKALKLSDLALVPLKIFTKESPDFDMFMSERVYYNITTVITKMFSKCGIQLNKLTIGFNSQFYFGGTHVTESTVPALPEMTCYEFLQEVISQRHSP